MTIKENELLCYTKMPRETEKSFMEYVKVRNLQPNKRNLVEVAKNNLREKGITQSHPNYSKELKKEHNRLKKLSEKWKWQLRFELYDNHKQLQLIEKQDATFNYMSNVLLDLIEGLLKYSSNLLGELIEGKKTDGEPLAVGTKIKYTHEITFTLDKAYDLLCRICGRPSTYSKLDIGGTVGLNMNNDKSKEELDQEYEDRFKQYLEDITPNIK